MTKKLQIPCLFHINVCYICNFSLVWSFRPTMFCFLLLRFNRAKHCRAIGQKDKTTKRLQTWLTYIRGLQLLQSSSRHQIQDNIFKKVDPRPSFFYAYSKVKNPKVGSFLRAPEDFEGLRSRKEKMIKTPSFFWEKNKLRRNFI